jgi:DNA modification methylase
MQTEHQVHFADARTLKPLADASVDLVVTSPPYPMIEMWDPAFISMNRAIGPALAAGEGAAAFEKMHRQLDRAWAACWRVLKPGGLLCVNIGDATRTLAGEFQLYANHTRIIQALLKQGFTLLPDILWRKPTNAPNKFMGSGMLPPGAYVTYEHEYVLIARRGPRRAFRAADRLRRSQSAYFWEERNLWFSDVWTDLRGSRQALARADRQRSGAFPLTLPWRLIQMFSLQGDVVLDPFLGTGTTCLAAAACGRSSVGVERDRSLEEAIRDALADGPRLSRALVRERLAAHRAFVAARLADGKVIKHHNEGLDSPVVTRQERQLRLLTLESLEETEPLRFRGDCT